MVAPAGKRITESAVIFEGIVEIEAMVTTTRDSVETATTAIADNCAINEV